LGGWLSDKFIKMGISVNKARKSIMTAAAILTIFSMFAAYAPTVGIAIAFMSLLMFAHGFFITNYVTIISEIFPRGAVGTVMGLGGTLGAVGGILANPLIGYITDTFSFMPIWIASGIMYPLAIVVLYVMIGPIRKLQISY
ncbi:MFS transporter, partial [bacterium]|nr:MFS transporter [bacterium]